jgi:hypothetical protein
MMVLVMPNSQSKAQMPVEEVRLWNLRYLADREGGVTRFAERIGRSQSQVSQLIGKTPSKVLERKLAREIEKACAMPSGWLDGMHVTDWIAIRRPDWRHGLRLTLSRAGITIDQGDIDRGDPDEAELVTAFRLMSPRDRGRLLGVARVFLQHQ